MLKFKVLNFIFLLKSKVLNIMFLLKSKVKKEGVSKVQDTPSFSFLYRFSSSDYAELTEHSCFTDYARNLNGFGLTAIGLAHSHSNFRGYRHDRQVEFPFKIRE